MSSPTLFKIFLIIMSWIILIPIFANVFYIVKLSTDHTNRMSPYYSQNIEKINSALEHSCDIYEKMMKHTNLKIEDISLHCQELEKLNSKATSQENPHYNINTHAIISICKPIIPFSTNKKDKLNKFDFIVNEDFSLKGITYEIPKTIFSQNLYTIRLFRQNKQCSDNLFFTIDSILIINKLIELYYTTIKDTDNLRLRVDRLFIENKQILVDSNIKTRKEQEELYVIKNQLLNHFERNEEAEPSILLCFYEVQKNDHCIVDINDYEARFTITQKLIQ